MAKMSRLNGLKAGLAAILLAGNTGCFVTTYGNGSDIYLSFHSSSTPKIENHTVPVNDLEKIVNFVTPYDPSVKDYIGSMNLTNKNSLEKSRLIYDSLAEKGFKYQQNAHNLSENIPTGMHMGIQYPKETMQLKTGDCKSLSILYSSLLRNQDIDARLVNLPGHMLVAINTGLSLKEAEEKYGVKEEDCFIYSGCKSTTEGSAWIPVQITELGKENFENAVRLGIQDWKNASYRKVF